MNINFHLILTTLNSFVLLYFFHTLTRLSTEKIQIKFSQIFFQIILFFTIISLVSILFQIILILDYKFFFNNRDTIKILSIIIIYLNLLLQLTKFKLKNIILFLDIGKKNIWIYFFLFILLLCSFGIVSDADSLIYHSKVSKIIISGFKINFFYDNPHYLLVGTFEIFNVLPELLGISNFNTLLNVYFLLLFIKFIFEKFKGRKFNSELFILIFISTPVLTIILTPQKSFFIPLIVQFLVFTFVLYNNKFIKTEYFLVLTALLLTVTFKLNFILTSLLIFICFFLKTKNLNHFKFIIKSCIIIFIIYLVPHYLFKTIFFDNPFPPFLSGYLENGNNDNLYKLFSYELKEWKRNSINYPISLFINIFNGSLSSLHNSLGIGILSFFLIKKFNGLNLKIILFFLGTILLLNFLLVQSTPRFYFLPFLISLLIILEADLKNYNLLKKFTFLQYFFSITALIFLVPISLSTTFFDSKNDINKEKFIFRYAANKKITQIVGKKKFILVDLPNYYSENFEISTMILSYITKEEELKKYKKYLNDNDVKYYFSVNFPVEEKIFKNKKGETIKNFLTQCFNSLQEQFSFETANRKRLVFNKSEEVKYFVYKKNKNCKFK